MKRGHPFRGRHQTAGYGDSGYFTKPARVGRIRADGYSGPKTMSMHIENTPEVRAYLLEMLAHAEISPEPFLRIEFHKIKGDTALLVLGMTPEKVS